MEEILLQTALFLLLVFQNAAAILCVLGGVRAALLASEINHAEFVAAILIPRIVVALRLLMTSNSLQGSGGQSSGHSADQS